MNIILLEFRSGWLSVSSSSTALASSSKIITDRDFRDLSFERISFLLYLCSNRRSPLGLRELKLDMMAANHQRIKSQPAWAAWIETFWTWLFHVLFACRSPLGLRELKLESEKKSSPTEESQPAWAAWIETDMSLATPSINRSQPAWAAWIETAKGLEVGNAVSGRSPLGLRELKQYTKHTI